MKNVKKLIAVIAAVGILGSAGAAYAATMRTPAEITAALTGKTVEDVNAERTTGKTYGTIANEAGKLDEFKTQMLEQKKSMLDQRVKDGTLTQVQADAIYNNMKNNQAACNGTGSAMMGGRSGTGLGQGSGTGICTGIGNTTGTRQGMGRGMGYGRGMMNRQ